MLNKIIRYLSHLDGVQKGENHESGSHYFEMTDIRVRVSDHFCVKFNLPTTLNIVCAKDEFVVTYGNKLLPIKTYAKLRQVLRTFAMVSDVLAPLAETRKTVVTRTIIKEVEKKVVEYIPQEVDSTPLFQGLTDKQKKTIMKQVNGFTKINSLNKKTA